MNLKFAQGLSLPVDAVTQKFAFLARSGAGKTYAAGVLVESLAARHDQFVVVDPVGVWWGLRLAADGKGKGIQVPVFGSQELPIYPESGALVARTIVEENISAVIDVSGFRKADRIRFMLAFAEEFFHLKKKHRSPVHLVIEEAQVFIPQFVPADMAKLVGAMEDIIKQGRNYGIGVSMISQRPQAVNKDVLNQAEVLVVLQTTGPQERKTIKNWIVEQGLDTAKLVDELPSLGRKQKGEAWVWSPSWLGITEKVQILPKWTYDVSKTPTAAVKKRAARALSAGDLETLREAMKAAVEKQKSEDPNLLRAEVAKLKRELASKQKPTTVINVTPKAEKVKITPMGPMLSKREQRWLKEIHEAARSIGKPFMRLEKILEKIENPLFKWEVAKPVVAHMKSVKAAAKMPVLAKLHDPDTDSHTVIRRKTSTGVRAEPDGSQNGEYRPTGGAKRMLEWLVQAGPVMSRRKIALVSRMKLSGGSFGTYLSQLKVAGCVELSGDDVILTERGAGLVPEAKPIPPSELIASWRSQFTGGARRMFEYLVDNDVWVSRSDLAAAAGMDVDGGSFGTYLSQLRTTGVIDSAEDGVRLHPDLRGA